MSAYSHTNPTVAVTVDIDYWSLKPKVRDIQWSPQGQAWLAHLYDEQTGLKGSMKVCMDCITVHIKIGCNGKSIHGFKNCNTNRPVFHPDHIKTHYELEPNNKYVQQAILRTHRRTLVPAGRHGILEFRGYDPSEKHHYRHVPACMRGSSPEHIIQGRGGLGTSIYYRRCDGKFRNLAHQVLEMGDEPVVAEQSPQQAERKAASKSIVKRRPYLKNYSTDSSTSSEASGSLKRKRDD